MERCIRCVKIDSTASREPAVVCFVRRQRRVRLNPKLVVLAAVYALLAGCRAPRAGAEPTIEFSRLPKADEGGSESRAIIEGRVTDARPGQQIVLFARSGTGVWWVQPFANQPFTVIGPESKWENSTHLGTEYAALLVEDGYRPPETTKLLPDKGGEVVAVATAKGEPSRRPVSRTLHFSGYEWEIRGLPSGRGGTNNTYDPANAWTDENGWLHLRIAQGLGQWTCAEVSLTRSLGYGSYLFDVRDVSHLEPSAAFSVFTWDDATADPEHRELDIEVSRWGDPANKNAQYVVQPYYIPANVVRFSSPAGPLNYSFRWQPGRVSFRTIRKSVPAAVAPVFESTFTSGVPMPGSETVHMNLYVYGRGKSPLSKESEVVIEKFEYLP
jgi:hypothetical protein